MRIVNNNGIRYFEFEIFQDFPQISHAVFTRHTDIHDKNEIKKALNISFPTCSFKKQLHSTSIWVVGKNRQKNSESVEREGDAMITNAAETPLLIRIADCAGILLFDKKNNVIANIHAGWRGLAQKIIWKTINRMAKKFGSTSENLHAAISPMIGPCCSRFTDPENELPKFLHRHISEENHVNLWAATEGQLRECGLNEANIENPRICTYCNPEDFFSYRREKNDKRFGTVIMLR